MASVGLPGTSSFIGEFLSLIGAYHVNSWVAFVATTGVILGAAYALYLYARVVYEPARQGGRGRACRTCRCARWRCCCRSPSR